MTIDLAALAAPFPSDRVSWRVGSTNKDKTKGMALAYIDARDVMERLDAVCGPGGWQKSYPHAGQKTVCSIGIRINDEWIWKSDGAGDSDVEAEKGALSDAFKRAAVSWGIGRYLYDLDSPWVEIEPMGRSFKIKDSEKAKLIRVAGGAVQPPHRNDSPHELTLGAKLAIDALKAATSADDFKATWEKNKDGWKAVLSELDYRSVVAVMQAEAKRWAPRPRNDDPFSEAA